MTQRTIELAPPMVKHPWFQPLRRRVITLVVLVLWAAFEWIAPIYRESAGGSIWLIIAAGVLAYAFWGFFLSGYYNNPPAAEGDEPRE